MIHAESSGLSLTGYKASLNLSLLFWEMGSCFLLSVFLLSMPDDVLCPLGIWTQGTAVSSAVMFGDDFGQ